MANSAFSAVINVLPTASETGSTGGLYPVISLANNTVIPGTGGATMPSGTTAQRVISLGAIRLNTQTGFFECSTDGATWKNLGAGGGAIVSITGTALQIDVTPGQNPIVSIDPGYLGQTSITTLGTIATGVWHGTAIAVIHGGTGLTSTVANQLLYSSATSTIAGLATASSSLLVTSSTGVPSLSGALTNGQVIIGSTGATPTAGTLTPGAGLAVVNGAASITTNVLINTFCQGRLSLSITTPITFNNVTAATTLYFSPYIGSYISLFTGGTWTLYSFTQLNIAIPNAATQMYDVFVYSNAGTLTLELVAWTNDSTRNIALAYQDGILVKSSSLDRRYVGSFRTTAVAGQSEDSNVKRYVYNYNNRVSRYMMQTDGSAGWTYTTATFRQADGNTANQVEAVIGFIEDEVTIQVCSTVNNSNALGAVTVAVGIGINSTSANSGFGGTAVTANGTEYAQVTSLFNNLPQLGLNVFVWLEYSSATATTTWLGTSAPFLSGISGVVRS